MRRPTRSWLTVALATVTVLSVPSGTPSVGRTDPHLIAELVRDRLAQVRERRQLPEIARSALLDRLARQRAEEIAAVPEEQRLPPARPLDSLLDQEPELAHRRAFEHIDVQRGLNDPLSAPCGLEDR